MDVTPYRAQGFSGNFDAGLKSVGVAGIDYQQAQDMIRLCPETEAYLYEGDFSPRRIAYQPGSRPELEAVVATLPAGTLTERAMTAMDWVYSNVVHPHTVGPLAPDRSLSEEKLIESRGGWCNEQARVFIALCEVMGIPGRLLFQFHANGRSGHTTVELLLDGRWVFFDPTFNLYVTLADGRLAEGRQLMGNQRHLAHNAYRGPLRSHYLRIHPFVEGMGGWNSNDRPPTASGGDLFNELGICNYIIEGVAAA